MNVNNKSKKLKILCYIFICIRMGILLRFVDTSNKILTISYINNDFDISKFDIVKKWDELEIKHSNYYHKIPRQIYNYNLIKVENNVYVCIITFKD